MYGVGKFVSKYGSRLLIPDLSFKSTEIQEINAVRMQAYDLRDFVIRNRGEMRQLDFDMKNKGIRLVRLASPLVASLIAPVLGGLGVQYGYYDAVRRAVLAHERDRFSRVQALRLRIRPPKMDEVTILESLNSARQMNAYLDGALAERIPDIHSRRKALSESETHLVDDAINEEVSESSRLVSEYFDEAADFLLDLIWD